MLLRLADGARPSWPQRIRPAPGVRGIPGPRSRPPAAGGTPARREPAASLNKSDAHGRGWVTSPPCRRRAAILAAAYTPSAGRPGTPTTPSSPPAAGGTPARREPAASLNKSDAHGRGWVASLSCRRRAAILAAAYTPSAGRPGTPTTPSSPPRCGRDARAPGACRLAVQAPLPGSLDWVTPSDSFARRGPGRPPCSPEVGDASPRPRADDSPSTGPRPPARPRPAPDPRRLRLFP